MTQPTARQLMEAMPYVFRADRARGANAIIQFRLSGEGGGDWYATVRDGQCVVTEGVTETADATIMMTADNYVALATRKLSGMKAFLTGKIKTSGDFGLLQKMQDWFPQ